MFKFTPIAEQMCFNIMPISVNQDGSVSATVSVGFIRETPSANGVDAPSATFIPVAQQSHYLSAAEAKSVLSATPAEGETIQDALSRAVHEALKAKGAIPF